jgi:hypothetical protein
MKSLKTKISIKYTLVLFIASTSLFGCKKDRNQGPVSGSQISFGVKADNSTSTLSTAAVNINATSTAAINWTEGIANVTKFKFEAKTNGVKKEIEVHGLTNINLFALDPSFVNGTIDSGIYNEIEVKLVFTRSNTLAIPLTLKGSFTKADGTKVPVEFIVNEDLEVKAEAKNVVIDKTTDLKTTIMLHLNQIFQGINAAALESAALTDGKIVISSTSNTTIFNKAKANVEHISGAKFEGEHDHLGGNDDNSGSGNSGDGQA